ncbi:MAG: PaaI family thioesterase [Oscillospiraceae bacterium]|nr:PaaI family thioesterase [Oscillospiraceae bacterium]
MLEQVRKWLNRLHEVAPGSAGDRLYLEALEYDQSSKEFLLRSRSEDWMRNAHGTLHGGLCATIADQAMGSVACCFKQGEGIIPAIELHLNYHRPLMPGEDVLIRVRPVSVTKTLIHMSAQLYRQSAPEKLCVSASATYFYKEMGK